MITKREKLLVNALLGEVFGERGQIQQNFAKRNFCVLAKKEFWFLLKMRA
jgi:hypothetical protein